MRSRVAVVCGFWAAILAGDPALVLAQAVPTLGTGAANHQVSSLPLPPRSPSSSSTGLSKGRTAPTASVWGTVAALAIVLGGLAVTARYLRKHGPASLRSLPSDAVEPLGQRLLSRGVTIHLVRCGSRVLLVGVGPDGARTLSEITDPIEVDLLTGACRRGDDAQPSFARVFRRANPVAAQRLESALRGQEG